MQIAKTHLNFMNGLDVLFEIRSTREGVAARFTTMRFVVVLMNLFDMRIKVWFGCKNLGA